MALRALFLGSLSFAIFLTADLAFLPAASIATTEQIRAVGSGFYSFERGRGTPFVWTSGHAELNFGTLDRRADWRLKGRIRLFRPKGVPIPVLRVAVDGETVLERNVREDIPMDIVVPRRPGVRGAHVTIDTTPAHVPGGKDSRQLGVTIDSISLAAESFVPPSTSALAAGVLAIVLLGTSMAAIGLKNWGLDVILVFTGWSIAGLMTRKLALYIGYPALVAQIAATIAAGAVLAVYAINRVRGERLTTAACGAIAVSVAACYLKLLVLLHPGMPVGDGVFHAHRFEAVLRGNLFFTSIAPGDYAFPYPVLLYIVSAPFSFLAPDTLDRMALLRIVATVSDAIAGGLLYWMIARMARDRVGGVLAVIWYHAIPMTAWIMTWGNLTNAFGQSLFVGALAVMVALPARSNLRWTVLLAAAVAAAAFLSHPSTFAISTGIFAAVAAVYYWRGGDTLRPNAIGVAIATAIALFAAVLLYYAWFPGVYISELTRVASEANARVSGPSTTIGARVALEPVLAGRYFGWAAIVSAIAGVWALRKTGGPSQLTLALTAWAGVCLLFVIVGVLSPMEFRYHFSFFPVLAVAAAYACAWAWRSRTTVRAAAVAVLTAGIWTGVHHWVWVLSW